MLCDDLFQDFSCSLSSGELHQEDTVVLADMAVQLRAVACSCVQLRAVQCSAVQCSAVQCSAV
jgi:hypothetical protein